MRGSARLFALRWMPICYRSSGGAATSMVVRPATSSTPARTTTATTITPRMSARRNSISRAKQEPLFPGIYHDVRRFEGEHTYHYGLHTAAIFRESLAMACVPAGCMVGYALTSLPAVAAYATWTSQSAFLAAIFALSRWIAKGRRNTIVKNMCGRLVLITGGTSGIGLETAVALAGMGADIIIASRPGPHVEAAMARIRKASMHPTSEVGTSSNKNTNNINSSTPSQVEEESSPIVQQKIDFVPLDLTDLIAVRDFCQRMRHQQRGIDVLINNAGALHQHFSTTRFGDDVLLATNFLGPYLLSEGLLPLVELVQGRVVYVSCSAHVGVAGNAVRRYLDGRGVWTNKKGSAKPFDGLEQYGFTKLGNIYHAQELALRSYLPSSSSPTPASPANAEKTRLAMSSSRGKERRGSPSSSSSLASAPDVPRYTACVCSPGGVVTQLYRSVPFAALLRYLYYPFLLIMRSPREGSQTVINCCLREELRNGGYYVNGHYRPEGLSAAACNVEERTAVLGWAHKRMLPYMRW